VLDTSSRKDTLAFQVDLWSARGDFPRNPLESEARQKDIRFSSRTRMATDQFKKQQLLRRAAGKLLAQMPKHLLQTPEAEVLAAEADEKVYNVIQLIFRSKNYGTSNDNQLSRRMMQEHWTSGHNDAVRTLRRPEVLQRPNGRDGFFTFDLGATAANRNFTQHCLKET
jgi:NTE family protein